MEKNIIKKKNRYLSLLQKGFHKKEAAKNLGLDLVMVRSWRMKDSEFNRLCKNCTVGKPDIKTKIKLKDQFIKLLAEGVSQREASRQLEISLPTIRTWKKIDPEFKNQVLELRFKD